MKVRIALALGVGFATAVSVQAFAGSVLLDADGLLTGVPRLTIQRGPGNDWAVSHSFGVRSVWKAESFSVGSGLTRFPKGEGKGPHYGIGLDTVVNPADKSARLWVTNSVGYRYVGWQRFIMDASVVYAMPATLISSKGEDWERIPHAGVSLRYSIGFTW